MPGHTVNLLNLPGTEKIDAVDLEEGDFVFTPTGAAYSLVLVRKYPWKGGVVIRTERSDGWQDYFKAGETITVRKRRT